MGRKETPTELKLLRGNPGRRKVNENEPKPPAVKKIAVPKEFKISRAASTKEAEAFVAPRAADEAGKEFNRLLKELEAIKLVTNVDITALKVYCEAYGLWVEATAYVNKLGLLTKAPGGSLIQNPYLAIVNKQAVIMAKIGSEFGFTPSSRASLGVSGKPEADDPLTELLKSRKKNA